MKRLFRGVKKSPKATGSPGTAGGAQLLSIKGIGDFPLERPGVGKNGTVGGGAGSEYATLEELDDSLANKRHSVNGLSTFKALDADVPVTSQNDSSLKLPVGSQVENGEPLYATIKKDRRNSRNMDAKNKGVQDGVPGPNQALQQQKQQHQPQQQQQQHNGVSSKIQEAPVHQQAHEDVNKIDLSFDAVEKKNEEFHNPFENLNGDEMLKNSMDELSDLSAFIESIVADFDAKRKAGSSEESSSEEMKKLGKIAKKKKPPRKRAEQKVLPNTPQKHADGTEPEVEIKKQIDPGTKINKPPARPPAKETIHSSTDADSDSSGSKDEVTVKVTGSDPETSTKADRKPSASSDLSRPVSANDVYDLDSRPKKSVSFNDVVHFKERPQSLISEASYHGEEGKSVEGGAKVAKGKKQADEDKSKEESGTCDKAKAFGDKKAIIEQLLKGGKAEPIENKETKDVGERNIQEIEQTEAKSTKERQQEPLRPKGYIPPEEDEDDTLAYDRRPSSEVPFARFSPYDQYPRDELMRRASYGYLDDYYSLPRGRSASFDLKRRMSYDMERRSPRHSLHPHHPSLYPPPRHSGRHGARSPYYHPDNPAMRPRSPSRHHGVSRRHHHRSSGGAGSGYRGYPTGGARHVHAPRAYITPLRREPPPQTMANGGYLDTEQTRKVSESVFAVSGKQNGHVAVDTEVKITVDAPLEKTVVNSDDSDEEDEEERRPRPVKVATLRKTRVTLLILAWIAMGVFSALPGSTLPYVIRHAENVTVTSTSYERAGRTVLARGAGVLAGGVLAGAVAGLTPTTGVPDVLLAGGLLLGAAGAAAAAPWGLPGITEVWLMGAAGADGAARGVITVASVLGCVHLLGAARGGTLIQALHVAMAMGAAAAPQLVRPIMAEENTQAIMKLLRAVGIHDILAFNLFPLIPVGEIATNSSDFARNADSLLAADLYNTSYPSTPSPSPPVLLEPADQALVTERLVFAVVALLPLLLSIALLGVCCYTRWQRCRKYMRDGQIRRYDARLKEAEEKRLQEKLGQGDDLVCNSDTEKLLKSSPENSTGSDNSPPGSTRGSDNAEGDVDIEDIIQSLDCVVKNENEGQREGGENNGGDEQKDGGIKDGENEGGNVNKEKIEGHQTDNSSVKSDKSNVSCSKNHASSNGKINDPEATNKAKSNVKFDINEKKEADKEAKPTAGKLKKKKKKTPSNPWFLGGQSLDVALLMYLYVFFTLPFAAETIMGSFLYSYARNCQLRMTELFASFVLSLFWASVALSRLAVLLTRGRASGGQVGGVNAVMVAGLTLNLLAASFLAAYADRVVVLLWLLTAVYGLTLGPLLPAGLTWANVYLRYTPKSIALAVSLSALGACIFPWLTGLLADYYGEAALLWIAVVIAVLSLLCYVPAMRGLAARRVREAQLRQAEGQRTYL